MFSLRALKALQMSNVSDLIAIGPFNAKPYPSSGHLTLKWRSSACPFRWPSRSLAKEFHWKTSFQYFKMRFIFLSLACFHISSSYFINKMLYRRLTHQSPVPELRLTHVLSCPFLPHSKAVENSKMLINNDFCAQLWLVDRHD